MLSIPHNPRVRRRLFEPDANDEARVDNFANILQESITRDRVEKSRKWNFDFENEVPLDGTYEWYPVLQDRADWIGVKSDEICDKTHVEDEDSCLRMKLENEVTPRSQEVGDLPILRKRRRNSEVVTDKAVRRKISFE